MNNKKGTKRALLSSVLALILCFSMLVGTTFAWFTDSVTSGNNKIVSGNLDIELEYWNGTGWVDVANSTELFDEDALWEPGYTQIVYLQLTNKGNLDIKYQLGMNIASETHSVNVNGEPFALSDYIYFGVVEDLNGETDAYSLDAAGREAAVADVEAGAKTLSTGSLKVGTMTEVDETMHLALVVYMPTWVGNEANYDKQYDAPTIELGINAVATQLASENDFFGSDYDRMAPWTGLVGEVPAADAANVITVKTGEELAAVAAAVNNGNSYAGYTIQLGADIDLNNVPWTPIGTAANNFNGSFDGNGYTIYNLTITGTEGVGLIGFAGNAAHIEEVKIVGAHVSGNHWVGAVLGYGYLAENTLKKCHVEDATIICTPVLVDGVYDDGDKVGAIAGMAINGNILKNTAKNCVVMGYRDVGGIVGLAQAEGRDINVQGNKVVGITMVYTGVLTEYADGTPNQNMGYYVGRVNEHDGHTVTVNGNYVPDASCYEMVATVVSTGDELSKALAADGNVVLVADTEVSEPIEIAEGVKTTLYLNGKDLSGNVAKDAGAVLENSGDLTIVGNGSDSLVNEAVNGGAVISNTGSLVLDGAVIEGASIGATGYPSYAIASSGNLTIEEGTSISSDRGALSLYGAGKTVINGGTFTSNDIDRTLTSHVVYVESDSTNELTINGGTFQHLDANTSGGVVINNWSQGTVYVNGGNFSGGNYWNESNLSTYGFGGSFSVTGGTYTHFKDAFLADGYKAIQKDGMYYVVADQIDSVASSATELEEALQGAEDVALGDDLEFSAEDTSSNSGYGATGVTVSGGVLDGNGNTLTVNDAEGTWDCAVHSNGGTIKNLTVKGAFRGILTGGLKSDLYIDNVIVDDVCYTVHADGNTKSEYSLIVTNSTLNGWTSYSDIFASVSFTNCTFGRGTGGYKYAYCRPYNDTVFVDCVFEEGFEFDARVATSIFVNCYYGETLITAENVAELLGSSAANVKFASNAPSGEKVTIVETATQEALDSAALENNSIVILPSGNFIIPDSAQGKTLTFVGNGDTVVATQDDGSYEGCDYSLDGSTAVFENIVINTNSATYTGYARLNATYNNCTINGTYTLYGDSVFNNCTFNVSGDVYNIWTWGAPNAEFNNCTFNSDGKAMLLYGTANTKLTLTNCTFNDKGGLTDLKAAVEIGNDYNKSYELIVNNTVVNGYEINDKGINTGSTLWANKNSMGTDKLNVVIDGVDVY